MSSARHGELATAYERARPRLVEVAYAVLGVRAEAEDVVADCWLRLAEADAREPVRDVEAWATVAVARAALDVLRSARRRREVYPGPWLPEPVVTGPAATGAAPFEATAPVDPADRVTLDDTVRYALLVVLETLSPAERTAWVLHDVFGMPFAEIAQAVGRTPAAVRQLASRARAHVAARAPRVAVTAEEHATVVGRFLAAAAGGDLEALTATLDPDVVLTSDGGGLVSAARRPVLGADRVVRFLLGLLSRPGVERRMEALAVNGDLGLGVWDDGVLATVVSFTIDGDRVTRIDMVRTPEKLPSLPPPPRG